MKIEDFSREELWVIEKRAIELADLAENRYWVCALNDLAQAADVLDAFVARSTLPYTGQAKDENVPGS